MTKDTEKGGALAAPQLPSPLLPKSFSLQQYCITIIQDSIFYEKINKIWKNISKSQCISSSFSIGISSMQYGLNYGWKREKSRMPL